MERMRSSAELVGDTEALRARFEEDGYVFLPGVLNADVIASAHADMVRTLEANGFAVVDESGGVRYTGKSAERFGIRSPRNLEEAYEALGVARRVIEHPDHVKLFESVAGEPVDFLPITEYRSRPPGPDGVNWHQDGFYNEGLDLYTAWIPLAPMSAELGGLAVAEGLHTNGYLHENYPPPRYMIPPEAIPVDRQRSALFQPGDVVVFDRRLPHTGLPNSSTDQFRFSIDVRFQKQAQRAHTVVGRVAGHTPESLTIRQESGAEVTLKLGANSRLRDWWGNDLEESSIDSSPLVEDAVLASHDGHELVLVRPVLV